MAREIKKIMCSCGTEVTETSTNEAERNEYGCPRDTEHWPCCVTAYHCPGCDVRWTVAYEAPEMDYM